MRWLGASGVLGPGVILTPDEISEAIEMGLERTAYYRQHLSGTNGQPVERLGDDNARGAVAEYGAREFWDLPHDGPDRVGQPDLGRMTDVKSIRRIGHRLMIPANQFHQNRRYLAVFADVRTGATAGQRLFLVSAVGFLGNRDPVQQERARASCIRSSGPWLRASMNVLYTLLLAPRPAG